MFVGQLNIHCRLIGSWKSGVDWFVHKNYYIVQVTISFGKVLEAMMLPSFVVPV